MLIPEQRLHNLQILSLRTGSIIGRCLEPIINPKNLKVEGFFVDASFSRRQLILITQDIREMAPGRVAVNDQEVLCTPDELVRLKDVFRINFKLVGKPVFAGKKRLGRVTSYASEADSLYIIKLYVTPQLWHNFSNAQLTIDRTDIVEITPKRIVIHDEFAKSKISEPARAKEMRAGYLASSSSSASEALIEE